MPARTRIMAVFSTPSFIAMASAVLKPMPRMSRAQPVRIFRHDLDSVGAVGLVDTHGPRRADSMAMQKDHDLADDLLLGPAHNDAVRPDRANAVYVPQA